MTGAVCGAAADLELQRHWGSVQGLVMVLDIDSLAWTRMEANRFSTYTHSTLARQRSMLIDPPLTPAGWVVAWQARSPAWRCTATRRCRTRARRARPASSSSGGGPRTPGRRT